MCEALQVVRVTINDRRVSDRGRKELVFTPKNLKATHNKCPNLIRAYSVPHNICECEYTSQRDRQPFRWDDYEVLFSKSEIHQVTLRHYVVVEPRKFEAEWKTWQPPQWKAFDLSGTIDFTICFPGVSSADKQAARVPMVPYLRRQSKWLIPLCSLVVHGVSVTLEDLQKSMELLMEGHNASNGSTDELSVITAISVDTKVESFDMDQFKRLAVAVGHVINSLKLELSYNRETSPGSKITLTEMPDFVRIFHLKLPLCRQLGLPIGGPVAISLQDDLFGKNIRPIRA